MNDRIKQIIEQSKPIDENGKPIRGLHSEYHDQWLENVAELIVKECCDIFVELRTRPADLAVKDVKKHFGVE